MCTVCIAVHVSHGFFYTLACALLLGGFIGEGQRAFADGAAGLSVGYILGLAMINAITDYAFNCTGILGHP